MSTTTTTTKQSKKEIVFSLLMNKQDAQKEIFKSLTIITYSNNGRLICAMFSGKSSKPFSHFYYQTEEKRIEAIEKQKNYESNNEIARLQREEQYKIEAEKIQVGSILFSSWGYEQTNIDFYIVLERKNDFVIIQEIGAKCVESGDMTGKVIADPTKVIGEPFRKKISKAASISLNSFSYCALWDGRPKYFSSYY